MAEVRRQFVRQMSKKVLRDSRITNPPVDLEVILHAHGIKYSEVEDFPDTVDALIVEDGTQIHAAVNARQHLHRRRFSLAHELGHFFLHRGLSEDTAVSIDNPPDENEETWSKSPQEIEADLFAGELLVPLEMLKPRRSLQIPDLAKVFLVSEQVVSVAISRHYAALFK